MKFPHPTAELRRAMENQSSYIENVLRHRMISDLCSILWQRNCHACLQVFNSEVDNAGFDLVLKLGELVRYVQIKQSHDRKKLGSFSTRAAFSKLNGSCIVLILHSRDDLSISSYRFSGRYPHEPMKTIDAFPASKSPGRRKADGERHVRNHYRNVPIREFSKPLTCEQLFEQLFPTYWEKQDEEQDPTEALGEA